MKENMSLSFRLHLNFLDQNPNYANKSIQLLNLVTVVLFKKRRGKKEVQLDVFIKISECEKGQCNNVRRHIAQ